MADFPAPQSATAVSTAPITAGVLAYALFAIAAVTSIASSGLPFIAPVFGLIGIAAVVVCYVKRDDAAGTWVASHLTWLIRTFWWSLLWSVIACVLFVTLIGIPVALVMWFVSGVWVIYRVIKGYLIFKDSRPIPGI